MKFNFKNRVRNFKFSVNDVFVPLYEAIINSIQAIDEKQNFENSYIDIRIERDSYRIADFTAGIFSIEITDNGIGFLEHNYESFCTSDSDYKVEIGGKGVGRINYLKAFELVKVNSVYEENGKKYQRTFDFNIDDEIHNEVLKEVGVDVESKTTITLLNLNQEYREATELTLKEIASKIIEHFATYFVIGAMPKVTLSDEGGIIDLNDYFEAEKFIQTKQETINYNNTTFNIRHVFLNASVNAKHKIYICAQNRVVCSYDILNIKDLPSTFTIDGKKAIYQCYVTGEFLDNDVNSERTYFSNVIFEEEHDADMPHFELAINLYEVVYNQVSLFMMDYLEPMRSVKKDQIANYIENNCPQYKYLVKYASDELENISYGVASSPEKLAGELNRLANKLNYKNSQQVSKTLQNASIDIKEKLLNLVVPLSENLRSEFTDYVVKRKAIVEMYERLLDLGLSTKEVIDDFFLLDEESSEFTNLWMIDERLLFSYQLLAKKDYFVSYINKEERSIIAILFVDFDINQFNDKNHPQKALDSFINKLDNHSNYVITKYVMLNNKEEVDLNTFDSMVKVYSYNELVTKMNNRIKSF